MTKVEIFLFAHMHQTTFVFIEWFLKRVSVKSFALHLIQPVQLLVSANSITCILQNEQTNLTL